MIASDFLIATGGRLDPAWYEPLDLEATLLPAWLAAATGSEAAVEASVYARGYETLADAIMMRPASEKADDIAVARSDRQLAHWQQQAAYWRGKAAALTGTDTGGPALTAWNGDEEPVWQN